MIKEGRGHEHAFQHEGERLQRSGTGLGRLICKAYPLGLLFLGHRPAEEAFAQLLHQSGHAGGIGCTTRFERPFNMHLMHPEIAVLVGLRVPHVVEEIDAEVVASGWDLCLDVEPLWRLVLRGHVAFLKDLVTQAHVEFDRLMTGLLGP